MTKEDERNAAKFAYMEILREYQDAKNMVDSMGRYIFENKPDQNFPNNLTPNWKLLHKRYGVRILGSRIELAWYLLEKYFEGKIKIE